MTGLFLVDPVPQLNINFSQFLKQLKLLFPLKLSHFLGKSKVLSIFKNFYLFPFFFFFFVLISSLPVPFQDTTYVTRICNQGACTRGELEISVCEETNQEEKINEGLEEVERELEGDDLEGALQTMVVLGDAELGCDDVQVFINIYISLKSTFIQRKGVFNIKFPRFI